MISFKITNFKNPGSTKPPQSFRIYTFTTNDFKIDKKESGIIATTDTAAPFEDLIISALNSDIAETTEYTITYTPINPHPIGATIEVTVPA